MPIKHAEVELAAALPPVKVNDRIIVNFAQKVNDPEYYTAVITEFTMFKGKPSVKVLFDDGHVGMCYAILSQSGIIGRAIILKANEKPIPASQLKKWVLPEDLAALSPDNGRATPAKTIADLLASELDLSRVKSSAGSKDVFRMGGQEDTTYGYLRHAFSVLKANGYTESRKGTLPSGSEVSHVFVFADAGSKNYAIYNALPDNTFSIQVGPRAAFTKLLQTLGDVSDFSVKDYTDLTKINAILNPQDNKRVTLAIKGLANADVQSITGRSSSGTISDQLPITIEVDKQGKLWYVTMVWLANKVPVEKSVQYGHDLLRKAVNGDVDFDNLMSAVQSSGVDAFPKILVTQYTVSGNGNLAKPGKMGELSKGDSVPKPAPKLAGKAADTAEKILSIVAKK